GGFGEELGKPRALRQSHDSATRKRALSQHLNPRNLRDPYLGLQLAAIETLDRGDNPALCLLTGQSPDSDRVDRLESHRQVQLAQSIQTKASAKPGFICAVDRNLQRDKVARTQAGRRLCKGIERADVCPARQTCKETQDARENPESAR